MNRRLKTGNLKQTLDNPVVPFTNDEQIELVKDNGFIESSNNNFPDNSNSALPASEPKHRSNKHGVKRKYNDSCLGFRLTWTDFEDYPDALWVICQTLLPNTSFVPAKNKRHFPKIITLP